jgi:hypothetical protein
VFGIFASFAEFERSLITAEAAGSSPDRPRHHSKDLMGWWLENPDPQSDPQITGLLLIAELGKP